MESLGTEATFPWLFAMGENRVNGRLTRVFSRISRRWAARTGILNLQSPDLYFHWHAQNCSTGLPWPFTSRRHIVEPQTKNPCQTTFDTGFSVARNLVLGRNFDLGEILGTEAMFPWLFAMENPGNVSPTFFPLPYRFRGRFGTKARNLRGLSTMIRCRTWSFAPATLSFGRNTVNVFE